MEDGFKELFDLFGKLPKIPTYNSGSTCPYCGAAIDYRYDFNYRRYAVFTCDCRFRFGKVPQTITNDKTTP